MPDGYRDDLARREGRAERLKRVLILLTAVTSVVALVFLIWVVILIRQTQTTNAPVVIQTAQNTKEIHRLAERIQSCTEPQGQCYQDAQARQADLIGEPRGPINTVTVLATYCQLTKGADTVPEIIACVDHQLAQQRGG
jgi:predicted PurR-regulated permease PerM